jgi:hypothetical protein
MKKALGLYGVKNRICLTPILGGFLIRLLLAEPTESRNPLLPIAM